MGIRGWVITYLCISAGCSLVCSEESEVKNSEEKLRQKRTLPELAGTLLAGAIDVGSSLSSTTIDAAINGNGAWISIGIVVENWTKWTLTNPVQILNYGRVSKPAAIDVYPGKEEITVASKSKIGEAGSSGVLSYYIPEINKSIYVMWSVPFNHAKYSNWLAVSVGERNRQYTFNEMYYGKTTTFSRGQYWYGAAPIRYSSSGVTVEGTMGTWKRCKAVIIVKPTDKANLAPSFKDVITHQL